MIYLITGQPGNGKSLYAMAQMREEFDRNAAAVKAGKEKRRDFYSNVAGATLEENPDAYPWVKRLPEHNDWTKLPEGSYIQYDEAHSDGATPGLERYGALFPATGKPGESQDPRVRSMSTHRHRGVDLVLITQYPNKIHHQVRTLVGQHVHMNRAMGLAAAGVVKWTRCQADVYDEDAREKAEEEIWHYPKGEYVRYKSATLHTSSYKFKIPKRVWGGLSMLVVSLLVAWALYYFLVPESVRNKPEKQAQGQGSSLPAAPQGVDDAVAPLPVGMGAFSYLATPTTPSLAGCVASQTNCRCFALDGGLIDMSMAECRVTVAGPMPFNIYHPFTESRSVATVETVKPDSADTALPGSVVQGDLTAVTGAGPGGGIHSASAKPL